MKIAIINETSAGDKNSDIMSALDGRGHELINAGMKEKGGSPELTYIHTGLLTALYLNTGTADLVVGGCGTGQGYLNSCMQYPGVFCGLVLDDLDAWLFRQINGGNCISLALNKGYGWAGDINLQFLFDKFFSVPRGEGYPQHRKESQQESLKKLEAVNRAAHQKMEEIIPRLDKEVLEPVLNFPGIMDSLDFSSPSGTKIKTAVDSAGLG
jgi:ribose 5-phosphate isomerase RpiB